MAADQLPLFAVPTTKQRRAIAILQANPGLEPLAFARLMWPKSKGWYAKAKFYWSMERVAVGALNQLREAGYAFMLRGRTEDMDDVDRWYAAVNIARVTLEPPPAEEPTPF